MNLSYLNDSMQSNVMFFPFVSLCQVLPVYAALFPNIFHYGPRCLQIFIKAWEIQMNPERHLWTHEATAFLPLLPKPPWHLSALEPSAIRPEFCMSHSGLLHSDDPISSTSRKPVATATLKMGLQSSCTSSKPTIRVCVARGKCNTFHICVVPLKPICPGLFLCSSAEQCCEKSEKIIVFQILNKLSYFLYWI